MSINYYLERVEPNDDWDSFLLKSNNSVLFSLSQYLKVINGSPGCYFVYNNNELRAAISVLESQDGKSTIINDRIIYNGIIFGPELKDKNKSQKFSDRFRIIQFISDQLTSIYDSIEISLDPSINDIRPFLWVNYGTHLPKYAVNVRYTSYVKIDDFFLSKKNNDIQTFKNASAARRQEIRYAKRKNVKTKENFDPELFIEFYEMTMDRQKAKIENPNLNQGRKATLDEIKKLIIELYNNKLGNMYSSYTADGDLGSIAFFAMDHIRAYYLFGANDPKIRSHHTGTAVIWDAFKFLSAKGIKEVDLEGVNSPNRGWFKLSFGGSLLPYYNLKWNNYY